MSIKAASCPQFQTKGTIFWDGTGDKNYVIHLPSLNWKCMLSWHFVVLVIEDGSFLQNTFWNVFTSITSVILPLKEAVLQTKYYNSKAMLLNGSSSGSQSSKNSPWSCGTNRPMIFYSVLLINALQKRVVCKSPEASHSWLTHCLPRSKILLQVTAFVLFIQGNASNMSAFSLGLQYVDFCERAMLLIVYWCTLDNETTEQSIHRDAGNGDNKALLHDATALLLKSLSHFCLLSKLLEGTASQSEALNVLGHE